MQVFNSFQEMAIGTGALRQQGSMSVFNSQVLDNNAQEELYKSFLGTFAEGSRNALRVISMHEGRLIEVAQDLGYQDVENMTEKEIRQSLKDNEGFREEIARGLAAKLRPAAP